MADIKESEMQIKAQSCLSEYQLKTVGSESLAITNSHISRSCYGLYWWPLVGFNMILLISGQSAATILGKIYFNKGGKSKWLATFVQSAGFPIMIPILFFSSKITISKATGTDTHRTCIYKAIGVYLFIGLLMAGDNMMYTYAAALLPASTFSILCASQLAFNSVFSFLINSQYINSFILNSVFLLIISSVLLSFQSGTEIPAGITSSQYAMGSVFNICASAIYALILSLIQFSFEKIFKKETFSAVLHMQIYTNLVATIACVIGLFASGEWDDLAGEAAHFELGRTSYILVNLWIAIAWQIFFVGVLGLVFMVSSLFSNVISTVSLPVTTVLSVLFLHEKISSTKIVSLILSLWGCLSFVYQQYLEAGAKPMCWSLSATKKKISNTNISS